MADTSVLVDIGQMIDLAIGTPEVGVVDFNMLQMVLHCLAQQLHVHGKTVELKSFAPLPANRDPTQTITISEFIVDTNDKNAEAKLMRPPPPSTPDQDTILVVERIKKTVSEVPIERIKKTVSEVSIERIKKTVSEVSNAKQITDQGSKSQGQGLATHPVGQPPQDSGGVTGPAKVSSAEKLSLVTVSKFNILENAVDDLKQRVYGSIPKNEDILEEVRSQTNLKAITDMWTSLNVSSRLEAAENGVAKLSSLVEDLIRESTGLTDAAKQHELKYESRRNTDAAEVAPESAKVAAESAKVAPELAKVAPESAKVAPESAKVAPESAKDAPESAKAVVELVAKSSEFEPTVVYEDLANVHEHLESMRADLDQLTAFYNTMKAMHVDVEGQPNQEGFRLVGQPNEIQGSQQQSASTADLIQRLCELEKQQRRCCDIVAKSEGTLQDQINSLQDQLDIVMKNQTSPSNQEISPDLVQDLKGLMQLFQTVQSMQEQLTQVHETALTLAAEKEDRQLHFNTLLEQIELLKTIKLDREDMVEAMAEKADMRMLARKVSHDQFELACDDLSRGLEHALGKLNVQESLWQQALDDIQREIETKLDKMELSPVKDFFNNKLKQLQENLKVMASLRREVEAAGTKKRLMRDVNCISCDAQAVMSMDPPMAMSSKPMPVTHSMKPYLSYELDAIRKTQASNLPQRNLHDWETMDKTISQPKPPQKVRSETDKHLCNRYCGGSHTVTTPSQRVARLGHFIKQWGPDVLPLSSGFATGDDGRMYKVSQPEGAKDRQGAVETTCTPKSPVKKSDTPKTPQKPVISGECRCLEGDHA